ncbi:trans-resveratrol di-O-methyltransferase-like [Diospyros lotus]|uniref:trans-resveratrol di-O-methyltransferase-like n=1 Tax=Diospyros lotus TaxID=55363 RepID=UPI002258407D|nr:trans-resveratrol di-O-methyltransferase-like [Diospyros lotus]
MAMANKYNTEELVQAHVLFRNQIFAFINSGSLRCAVQFGIPDVIHSHGKPMALSELVVLVQTHKNRTHCCASIHRLMRVLVHSGFFVELEEGYVLILASRLLLKYESLSVRAYALMTFHLAMVKPWSFMSNWFQNDDNVPFYTIELKNFWEYNAKETSFSDLFNAAMANDSKFIVYLMMKECKAAFEGLSSLVDVGDGTGIVAWAIVESFPNMKCTMLDLPRLVANCQGSEKLDFVGGSMFEAIPLSTTILHKEILHDWDDETCIKILKKCKEAIASKENGGKVIVIDVVLDNQKEDDGFFLAQLFLDTTMFVVLACKERARKEWAQLFYEASFSHHKITRALGIKSLIEAYP